MAKFVILVQFRVEPSQIASFREEMREAAVATRKTPGNRAFEINEDPLEPTRFMLYEVFEDEAAWREHHGRTELQAHLDRVRPMLAVQPERSTWSQLTE